MFHSRLQHFYEMNKWAQNWHFLHVHSCHWQCPYWVLSHCLTVRDKSHSLCYNEWYPAYHYKGSHEYNTQRSYRGPLQYDMRISSQNTTVSFLLMKCFPVPTPELLCPIHVARPCSDKKQCFVKARCFPVMSLGMSPATGPRRTCPTSAIKYWHLSTMMLYCFMSRDEASVYLSAICCDSKCFL